MKHRNINMYVSLTRKAAYLQMIQTWHHSENAFSISCWTCSDTNSINQSTNQFYSKDTHTPYKSIHTSFFPFTKVQ